MCCLVVWYQCFAGQTNWNTYLFCNMRTCWLVALLLYILVEWDRLECPYWYVVGMRGNHTCFNVIRLEPTLHGKQRPWARTSSMARHSLKKGRPVFWLLIQPSDHWISQHPLLTGVFFQSFYVVFAFRKYSYIHATLWYIVSRCPFVLNDSYVFVLVF